MDGQRLAGKATIPLPELARQHLGELFPNLSPAQVEAIREGRPVPGYSDLDLPGKPATPLISAVLVAGVRGRLNLARKAVNQFLLQTYENKQLVIVNSIDTSVTTVTHPRIKEIRVKPATLGGMRNHGLAAADGEFVFPCWDDDDCNHPMRMAYQAGCCRWGEANLLAAQVRVDIERSCVFVHSQEEGIANTMLVARSAARFPEAEIGEDVAYWMEHWSDYSQVLPNPLVWLSIAVYHGHNVTARTDFMGKYAAPEYENRVLVSKEISARVMQMLAPYGLNHRMETATSPHEAQEMVSQ